jgi:AraC-like DNA-binding protein
VWLPRLYPSILPVYAAKCRCPKPPKGVGFTDPLSGTLKAVAADCGFADQSHFNRTFRKVVGLTPDEYRKGM